MSITITEKSGLSYKINQNDFTAQITKSEVEGNLFIPRSIFHQSQEYVITEINKNSFQYNDHIESIEFSKDSRLRSIGEYAFAFSSLKSISIPSTVKELKYGWCSHSWSLANINLSPDNENFAYIDDTHQIIVGKSDTKTEIFDVIVFGSRDIEKVDIPSYITSIYPFSFSGCTHLKIVNFSEDSQIHSIGDFAFSFTSIKEILIPKSVEIIGESCFSECERIQRFDFALKSKLKIIGKSCFQMSSIDFIEIPKKVEQIDDCAFAECSKLQQVYFNEKSKLKIISKNMFYHSSIEQIQIPKNVIEICKGAFSECYSFKTIKFSKDSELKIIDQDVFSNSSIESLSLPSKIEEIKDGWCSHTINLNKISISPKNSHFSYLDQKMLIGKSDDESDIYDVLLFARRNIEIAVIPSFIKKICQSTFSECKQIQSIIFTENSELESIGDFAFADSSISTITLPSSVIEIGSNAFNQCKNLKNLYFQENSKLKTIGEFAFSDSTIESLSIPPNCEEFKNGWCCYTYQLNSITISPLNKNFAFLDETKKIVIGKSNSNIEYFDSIVFACRDIESMFIPSHIKKINSFSFFGCRNLQFVKFSIENSELYSIDK